MAIYRRSKDGPWYVNFRYHDQNGKLKQFRRTTGRGTTKKQAQQLERQWKRELEAEGGLGDETTAGNEPEPVNSAAFSGFAKYWQKVYVKVNNRPSEIEKKQMHLRVHLVPFFGDIDLRAITSEQVTQFMAQKREKGLSPKTVNNILGCLRTMLNMAKKWGYLEHNPVDEVSPLKVPPSELEFYDAEESALFLEIAEKYEPKWFPFFLTLFRTGVRIGELFALSWENVDFDRKVIRIRSSYDGKNLGPTKSGKGRDIPMSEQLIATLKPLKRARKELVFPDRKNGYLNRNKIKHPFWRIIKKAKLRTIRLHDVRHSFASQLVMKGVHLRTVQDLLGHSDIRMTERYSHLSPSVSHDAVNKLD